MFSVFTGVCLCLVCSQECVSVRCVYRSVSLFNVFTGVCLCLVCSQECVSV